MADYHSLLTRAVANLPSGGTPGTREAIYVRARNALIEQLRSLRPPLPESDIAREANALDAAIAKIEANFPSQQSARSSASLPPAASTSPPGGKAGASPPPSPKPVAPTAPAQSAASQRPVTPGPAQSAPIAGSPAQQASAPRPPFQAASPAPAGSGQPAVPPRTPPPPMSPPRAQPATSAAPQALTAPAGKPAVAIAPPAALSSPGRPQPAVGGAKPAPSLATRTGAASSAGARDAREENFPPPPDLARAARSTRADEVHSSAAPPVVATRSDELVQSAVAPEVPGEFDRPGAVVRQDLEGQRPIAPGIDAAKPKRWLWIAAAVALGVVLAVAGAAILMRQKPQDLAIKPHVEATAPPAAEPPAKIAERVEAPPATPAAPPPSASEPKVEQPAAQGAAPANPPASPQNNPPAASPAPAQAAAPAPSGGRAAMLVASADNPQKPVVSLGSTVWSLIPAAPGQPASVAVKAEADIPDLKMHATMTLRKNTDPTLQATHTIDLKFSFADGAPITGFKDVGLPQMRMEDSTAAEALTSVKVKISDVYFLIALAKGESDTARNLDLMKTRAWFDFPLLLNDDRIAKVVFQKSPEGQAMLEKAFDAWK